jgi:hypothetical protein
MRLVHVLAYCTYVHKLCITAGLGLVVVCEVVLLVWSLRAVVRGLDSH